MALRDTVDYRSDRRDLERRVRRAQDKTLVRIGLVGEREVKSNSRVDTGTYRRAWHIATPGYAFSSDNVTPSSSSPERGGQAVDPERHQDGASIQLGNGMLYALELELMDHTLEQALDVMRSRAQAIARNAAREEGL